jgi:peptidoglycan/xylan/chitin deacetylase (PgdA/CDA1 family)
MPRERPANRVLVLGYHGVSREWPQKWAVTPDALEAQVRILTSRGWTGTTFLQAVTEPSGGRRFAVTFDDAYRSIIELGLPVLNALGVPATVFVPTDFADRAALLDFGTLDRWHRTPWEEELRCMSWDELRRLRDAGWEIGSHSRTHRHLSALSDDDLAGELRHSKARCEEELGLRSVTLAYPFSDRDGRVVAAAKAAGYAAAGADETAPSRPPFLYEWPRVSVYRSDSLLRFRLRISPTASALLWRLRRQRGA